MAKKTPGGEASVVDHKFFQYSKLIPLKEMFENDYEADDDEEEESLEEGIHGNQFSAHPDDDFSVDTLNKSVLNVDDNEEVNAQNSQESMYLHVILKNFR